MKTLQSKILRTRHSRRDPYPRSINKLPMLERRQGTFRTVAPVSRLESPEHQRFFLMVP
jgi:hypothetical protein